jgi:hypothetical protein
LSPEWGTIATFRCSANFTHAPLVVGDLGGSHAPTPAANGFAIRSTVTTTPASNSNPSTRQNRSEFPGRGGLHATMREVWVTPAVSVADTWYQQRVFGWRVWVVGMG